jgi:hypothetical protein
MPFGLSSVAGLLAGRAAHRVAMAGRRLLFLLLGGLCLLVVLGFLAAALFTWLLASYGVFVAELGLAAIFLLLGLIFLLVGTAAGRGRKPTTVDPLGIGGQSVPAPALLVAFALGFLQGIRRSR